MGKANRTKKPRSVTVPDELMKIFEDQFGGKKTFSGWICEKLVELSSSVSHQVTVEEVCAMSIKLTENWYRANFNKFEKSDEGFPISEDLIKQIKEKAPYMTGSL